MYKIIIAVTVFLIIGLVVSYLVVSKKLPAIISDNNQKACTLEAKVCPDGSSVGRTGPNCEFAACPTESETVTPIPDVTSSGPVAPNVSPSTNPSTEGEKITVTGKMICLPHKNTSGPQTMECAMGMSSDSGKNYALSDPNWKFLIGVGTEQKITVTGILKPPANDKYDTVGTIEISNLTKD
jgi:hypothetical protein